MQTKINIDRNTLALGDNLTLLSQLPNESIDLIYLDPPFNSNRNYTIVDETKKEVRAFGDIWKGGSATYLEFLKDRLIHLHRVLKATGSIYLHCDPTESHYIKVLMDSIFGRNNFRNEIVWCYERSHPAKYQFKRIHDIILFYTKSDHYTFIPPYVEGSYGMKKRPPFKRPDGTIWEPKHEGKLCPDWWIDIPSFGTAMGSKERCNYPTQKPLALLERIIKASSNEGNLVLDPFMGSGTTLVAASRLNRNFIGMDSSASALAVAKERLKEEGVEEVEVVVID